MRSPQPLIRPVVCATVVAATTAVALQLSTGPAAADEAVQLAITSVGDLVVDGSHQRIFISDPKAGQVITTDYEGKVLATATGLPDVRDLMISDRLYAAVPRAGSIVAFDPATSKQVATYDVGGQPRTLAAAAGKIWFGDDDDGLGSVDLSGPKPVITRGIDVYNADHVRQGFVDAPVFATSPGRPSLLAALDSGTNTFSVLDVSADPPTIRAQRSIGDRGTSLAFSPDGSRLIVTGVQGVLTALSSDDLSTVEKYRATDSFPHAVAVRQDGTIAVVANSQAEDAVALYTPGTADATRQLDLQQAVDANGDPIKLSMTSLAPALAWEPGGNRLFGVAVKGHTGPSEQDIFTLQVLNHPKPVTLHLFVAPTVQVGDAYTVGGSTSDRDLAGLPVTITRTDAATPGGRRVGPQTLSEFGGFQFDDVSTAPGTVTYTVSFPGTDLYLPATATASTRVTGNQPTTLTLDRSFTTWAYGTKLTLTAKLGPTQQTRTVEIWANPDGDDEPDRLLRAAAVDGRGNLTASFTLTRDTTFTAIYRGDSTNAQAFATSFVGTKALVKTTTSGYYKTAKIGSTAYFYFRAAKNPRFTTTMNPVPERQEYREIEYFTRNSWVAWQSGYFPLNSAGVSVTELTGTHPQGVRFRMRSAYLRAKSGDVLNVTNYGPYQYFTFTK